MSDRHLDIPGLRNARDLGGLPTPDGPIASRVLIRCAAPVDLDTAAQQQLIALGVRTAVDLREPIERDNHPPSLGATQITLLDLPLIDGSVDLRRAVSLEDFYDSLLTRRGAGFARLASALAQPGVLPAIVFCSAGKDRTGMATALMLSAVGVGDEQIAADYALTAEHMSGEFLQHLMDRARVLGLTEQVIALAASSPAPLMLDVLAQVRERHGSAAGYLQDHGLSETDLGALRAALLGG